MNENGSVVNPPNTDLIAKVILEALPGLELARVVVGKTSWSSRDRSHATTYEARVILDAGPGPFFSGGCSMRTREPDLEDILETLSEAMRKAKHNECSCCGLGHDWPSFEEVAAKIAEALRVAGLSI
jgi:hypothetical protein